MGGRDGHRGLLFRDSARQLPHNRWVRARGTVSDSRACFLARWPSRKAAQHARDRIRQITDRKRLWMADEWIVEELNWFLRGSPGVPSLLHDVAPDALRRAFCNTSPWVWCSLSLLLRSLAVADPPHVQHLTWRRRVVDHGSTRMIR